MFRVTAQQEPSSSICFNVVIRMSDAQSGETFALRVNVIQRMSRIQMYQNERIGR